MTNQSDNTHESIRIGILFAIPDELATALVHFRQRSESLTLHQSQVRDAFLEFTRSVMNSSESLVPIKYSKNRTIYTDCFYYSGLSALKCAVNPTEPCQTCKQFESK